MQEETPKSHHNNHVREVGWCGTTTTVPRGPPTTTLAACWLQAKLQAGRQGHQGQEGHVLECSRTQLEGCGSVAAVVCC